MMDSFDTAYKVILFDGQKEHDKGNVGVHSMLTFKKFQILLSQKTGLPPFQQSVFFVCRRTQKFNTDKRQKLPVNENTNFSIILSQHHPTRDKDCYFYVTVKRSKKGRKAGRLRREPPEIVSGLEEFYESGSSKGDASPTDGSVYLDDGKLENYSFKKMLNNKFRQANHEKKGSRRSRLRAACQVEPTVVNFPVEMAAEGWRALDNNERYIQDEPYQYPAILVPRVYRNTDPNQYHQMRAAYAPSFYQGLGQSGICSNSDALPHESVFPAPQRPKVCYVVQNPYTNHSNGNIEHLEQRDNIDSEPVLCEQCWMFRGRPVPFHFCIYDTVVTGFRGPSTLGPIERPVKAAA